MMLNRDDDDHVALSFVDYAVRKSMNLAAARALRQRRPGFGIISEPRDGFFYFVRKLETLVPRVVRCSSLSPLGIPHRLRRGK